MNPRDQRAIDRTVSELADIYQDQLIAVVVYGEAASASYRPRRSPLTLAVVLRELTPAGLRRMRPRLRAWQRRRIPIPLVMDPLYIASSLDVFPLEFLDIADQRRLLWGAQDPFASLDIDSEHLRLEVEGQMRGKMLHLWEAYLQAGRSKRRLKRMLLATPPDFELIMHGMLYLHGDPRPDEAQALLTKVESVFDLQLPTFKLLEEVRGGGARLSSSELEEIFEAYLAEVRALVRVADSL